jgi:hypothetical protein
MRFNYIAFSLGTLMLITPLVDASPKEGIKTFQVTASRQMNAINQKTGCQTWIDPQRGFVDKCQEKEVLLPEDPAADKRIEIVELEQISPQVTPGPEPEAPLFAPETAYKAEPALAAPLVQEALSPSAKPDSLLSMLLQKLQQDIAALGRIPQYLTFQPPVSAPVAVASETPTPQAASMVKQTAASEIPTALLAIPSFDHAAQKPRAGFHPIRPLKRLFKRMNPFDQKQARSKG